MTLPIQRSFFLNQKRTPGVGTDSSLQTFIPDPSDDDMILQMSQSEYVNKKRTKEGSRRITLTSAVKGRRNERGGRGPGVRSESSDSPHEAKAKKKELPSCKI